MIHKHKHRSMSCEAIPRHYAILLQHWLTCFHVQLSVTAMLAARTTAPSLLKMAFNKTDQPVLRVPTRVVDVGEVAVVVVATLIDTAEVLEGENMSGIANKNYSLTCTVNLRSKQLTDGVPPKEVPNSLMK